jgi:hypothetical protein
MAAGGIPIENDAQAAVFRTPVFVALLVLLCLLLAFACARYGRSWRQMPFWLAHGGVVTVLLGAALGAAFGVHGRLALPVEERHAVDRLPTGPDGRGEPVPLGFRLSVRDFKVDYYLPAYLLYAPKPGPAGTEAPAFEAELALRADGSLPVPGRLPLGKAELWDERLQDWTERYDLPDGRMLQRGRRAPRTFEAALALREGGVESVRPLRVNSPVTVNDWRVYLESYGGRHPDLYVQLRLRRDPGRPYVILGIWMVIAGTAWLCWRRGVPPEAMGP